jgi:predicted GNAT family acetyltransferase
MEIRHDTGGSRFTAAVEGGEAELAFVERDAEVLDLVHTYVPGPARGHGVGKALVEHAMRFAEDNGYRVQPSCPFVRAWLGKHPEWQRLAA